MATGIKLDRKILDHWVAKSKHSYSQFEAWVDILLCVNEEDNGTFTIDGVVFKVKRGQSLHSLDTWAKRWRWDKSKVRRFLDKLKSDEIIRTENVKKSTLITVCKYDTYNGKRHKTDTLATPNNNILSKDSNINIRKKAFAEDIAKHKDKYKSEVLREFYNYWSELTPSKTKMKFETEKTWETHLRLSKWNSNAFTKKETKPIYQPTQLMPDN
jgi:hypothetical protein